MSKGKIASQAGHAYLGAFLNALKQNPQKAQEYHADGIGTKVCLQGSLDTILVAKARADLHGIPCFLVIDSGCPDFFEGQPTVTALGLGPEIRNNIKHITGNFRLL